MGVADEYSLEDFTNLTAQGGEKDPMAFKSCRGLPRAYTPELYQGQVAAGFEHVFENYQGEGSGEKGSTHLEIFSRLELTSL